VTALDDFKRFVTDAESGSQYAKWAHDNPGDLGRWQAFRDLILSGARPAPPAMTSAHGRELVDGGLLYLDATAPAPTPPPASAAWWDARTAPLDPASAALMATWLSYAIVNPNMPVGNWAVATADATAGDPTYAIPLTKQGGTLQVRCPLGTKPDPSGDGHLTIRDGAAGTETDLWQAIYDASTGRLASASAGVTFPLGSIDEHTTGWGGDAANLALRPFLIRPEEIAAGLIDHPLAFGCPLIGTGAPRYPATHNAPTGPAGHLVEGTWLRLDPAYDLAALTGWQRTVGKTMQEHGMFLRDNSGSLAIYGENTINRPGAAAWPFAGTAAPFSAGFPWARMQVLAPPAVT
jgi:hypothetical protein